MECRISSGSTYPTHFPSPMRLFLLSLLACPLFAVVPTITGQQASSVSHASFHYRATVDPAGSYVQLFVSTSSGSYASCAAVVQCSSSYLATDNSGAGLVELAINDLAASTTYYVCLKARPNQDNDTDITDCSTMGYQITVNTSANPTHPVVPDAPTEYSPSLPSTVGYTTVTLDCSGSPTVWRAAANVTNPGDWTGNVTDGDTLQTVLQTVYFGTIIEFPQSTTCANDTTGTTGTGEGALTGVGYYLPYKTVEGVGISSASHRWIILRTVESASTDFPPAGVQIDPSFTKVATIQATGVVAAPSARGQCFLDDGGVTGGTAPTHHYMIQHLACIADPTLTGTNLAGTMIQIGRPSSAGVAANPPDYIILDQVIIRGAANAYTLQLFSKLGKHVALQHSYLDRIKYLSTDFAASVKIDDSDQGFFSLKNTYIQYQDGFGVYAEANATSTAPVAKDTVYRRLRLRLILPSPDTTYHTRQPVEWKRCQRVEVVGSIIDGSMAKANEGPMLFVSANTDRDTSDAQLGGCHNVRIHNNILQNGMTVFDCMGVRPPDNPGPPENILNSVVYFDNNWTRNMGPSSHWNGGGGLSGSQIWLAPGCRDVTFKNNTFNRPLQEDTRSTDYDLIPGLFRLQGGATLMEGFTFADNIAYINTGIDAYSFNGRYDASDNQNIASHPQTPEVNLGSTPSAFLSSYSSHNNDLDGNVLICGQDNTGSNTWVDIDSSGCTTAASGMPGTNTWATGATVAARESNVGFTPSTGACTGCSGAGADIGAIYDAAGVVRDVTAPIPAASTAAFSYTAPDATACNVEASTSSTFATITSRTSDGGGAVARTPTVTGLTANTLYYYRILCAFRQVNAGDYNLLSVAWPSGQITEGSFTTLITPSATIIRGNPTLGGNVILR